MVDTINPHQIPFMWNYIDSKDCIGCGPLRTTVLLLPGAMPSRTAHSRDMGVAHSHLQGCYILTPGAADADDRLIGNLRATRGWNLKVPNMATLDNSDELFRLQSSLKNMAETRCQPYPHLCLTFCPHAVSLTSLQSSPGSICSINHLHENAHLRLCFYASRPQGQEEGKTGGGATGREGNRQGKGRTECESGLDQQILPVFSPTASESCWNIPHPG